MTTLLYKFRIPDPSKPISYDGFSLGPTGELVNFKPPSLTADMLVGRTVDKICICVGTYGMGGPGFFGLRLGSEWLVIAIWGAASWVQVDGRIVSDGYWDENGRPRPWITEDGDELAGVLVGQIITSFEVARHSLTIGIGERTLTITESPANRPIRQGNQQPRSFKRADDLRKAVFLSPTAEIWI